MLNPINVQQNKEKILSLLKTVGPSLPVNIARAIGVEPLFAGAFLSELYGEKKIKMSNMKVGSSPLYYLEGQENLLEKFIEHLNVREREAFSLLQKERVLDDNAQTPVIRVALRAVKDFAMPIRARVDGETRLFWKYFLSPDSEIKEMIEEKISGRPRIEETEKIEKPAEIAKETEILSVEKPKKLRKRAVKRDKIEENVFSAKIKDYLSAKDIEIMDVISNKKKEFFAKIRIDAVFGKQEFLLIAKDKKLMKDKDFELGLQMAQAEKMPAFFISSGGLNKKAQDYLREWRNLIKFEKL